MATVEVTFTALPAHVRTARLVATAVARRSGVAESLLDEVRLAVGEACSRAVEAHQLHCPAEPVRIALTDRPGRFEIEVVNTGRGAGLAGPASDEAGPGEPGPGEPGPTGTGPPGTGPAGLAGDADLAAAQAVGAAGQAGHAGSAEADAALLTSGFSLAVIAGLADDVQISETAAGTSVRMSWPSSHPAASGSPA